MVTSWGSNIIGSSLGTCRIHYKIWCREYTSMIRTAQACYVASYTALRNISAINHDSLNANEPGP